MSDPTVDRYQEWDKSGWGMLSNYFVTADIKFYFVVILI